MPKIVEQDIRMTVSRRLPFFYGWVMVATAFLGTLGAGGTQAFTFGVFIKPMSESLGWSRAAMTGALTLYSYTGAVIGPLLGRLVDRHGPRPIMIITAILGGAATLLLCGVEDIWQFYMIYAVIGLCGGTGGAGGVVTEAMVSKWFIRIRGRALAFASMGIGAAGVLLAPLVGIVIAMSGWRAAWLVVATVYLGLLLPISALTARRPEDMGLLPDGAKSRDDQTLSSTQKNRREPRRSWTFKEAFRTKALWILLGAEIIVGFPASSVVVHQFSYLTDEGFSTVTAAAVLSVNAAGAAAARLVWGLLAERYAVRYCLAGSYVGSAIGLSILLVAVGIGSVPMLFVFSLVYGLNIGAHVVLTMVAIADYFGRDFVGTIRGAFMSIIAISSLAIGPLLISLIHDIQGTYFNAFLVMVGMFLLSTVLVLFSRPPARSARVNEKYAAS